MGRHINKKVLNGRLSLSVFQLRRLGYFVGAGAIGSLSWSTGGGVSISRISIASRTTYPSECVTVAYELNNQHGEKENLNYSIPLTASICNYGGVRYWFICPLDRGGTPCGRRVAALYLTDRYFGCRQCLGLTYRSQRISHYLKESDIYYLTTAAIEYASRITRVRYKNAATRKQRRFQKMHKRLEKLGILSN